MFSEQDGRTPQRFAVTSEGRDKPRLLADSTAHEDGRNALLRQACDRRGQTKRKRNPPADRAREACRTHCRAPILGGVICEQ